MKDLVSLISLYVAGEQAPRVYVTKAVRFEDNLISFSQEGSENVLTFPIGSLIMSEELSREELDKRMEAIAQSKPEQEAPSLEQ